MGSIEVMWGLDIAAQVRILFGADLFQIFFFYRQHIICALTPHVLTSLHIVLGTQGQVHAVDTSGAYLGLFFFFSRRGDRTKLRYTLDLKYYENK